MSKPNAIALLLALAVCFLFVGTLDYAVAWNTRAVPQIAHGGYFQCSTYTECEQLFNQRED